MTEKHGSIRKTTETGKGKTNGADKAVVYLTAEQIIATDDKRTEEVYVDEWGGTVRIRNLTSYELEQLGQSSRKGSGADIQIDLLHWRAKLLSLACIKEDGSRLFQKEHVLALSQKNSKPVSTLVRRAQELSGITEPQQKAAEENLGPTLPGDSLSG